MGKKSRQKRQPSHSAAIVKSIPPSRQARTAFLEVVRAVFRRTWTKVLAIASTLAYWLIPRLAALILGSPVAIGSPVGAQPPSPFFASFSLTNSGSIPLMIDNVSCRPNLIKFRLGSSSGVESTIDARPYLLTQNQPPIDISCPQSVWGIQVTYGGPVQTVPFIAPTAPVPSIDYDGDGASWLDLGFIVSYHVEYIPMWHRSESQRVVGRRLRDGTFKWDRVPPDREF